MTEDSRASGDDMKIYLAGPLFSTAEREFNARLAGLLRESGHEVWLPQESEQRSMTARQIFAKDVEGVDWAEVVVANMDGPDPDSGTCWECGHAYKKKPVIVFRTDFRTGDDPDKAPYNLMLTESATQRLDLPFTDTVSIATSIDQALRNLAPADRKPL
jgi:nucleoside 2-deoxyribosyltransferase